jgi:hypothetical protein
MIGFLLPSHQCRRKKIFSVGSGGAATKRIVA